MIKSLSGGEKRKEGHSRQREEPVVFKGSVKPDMFFDCLNSVWLENRKVEDIGVDGYIEVRF